MKEELKKQLLELSADDIAEAVNILHRRAGELAEAPPPLLAARVRRSSSAGLQRSGHVFTGRIVDVSGGAVQLESADGHRLETSICLLDRKLFNAEVTDMPEPWLNEHRKRTPGEERPAVGLAVEL